MKTKVVIGSAIMVLFACSVATAQWPQQTLGNRTGWEAEIGARIIDRPGNELGIPLVISLPTLDTVFDSDIASDLDTGAGFEARFLRQGCYEGAWEIRSTYNSWDVSESRQGFLFAPSFTPPGLDPLAFLSSFTYAYDSELFNFELNYKKNVRNGISFLMGPRFTYLQESINIDATITNAVRIPPLPTFVDADIDTVLDVDNPMIGMNFGMEIRKPIIRDLFFVGGIKAAIFANFSKAEMNVTSTVLGVQTTTNVLNDDQSVAAGLGELTAKVHYDIVPGSISFYGGYEAMWIDGAAYAPAQFLSVSALGAGVTPTINTDNTGFFNGLVFGGMVRF